MGCIPSHALFFANYEISRKHFHTESRFSLLGNSVIGLCSCFLHDVIMTPALMIKQRMQISGLPLSYELMRRITRSEGFGAFWKSFPVNFAGNLPSGVFTIVANENLKVLYQKYYEMDVKAHFAIAGVAGAICSMLMTPLDNIKTRLNV